MFLRKSVQKTVYNTLMLHIKSCLNNNNDNDEIEIDNIDLVDENDEFEKKF